MSTRKFRWWSIRSTNTSPQKFHLALHALRPPNPSLLGQGQDDDIGPEGLVPAFARMSVLLLDTHKPPAGSPSLALKGILHQKLGKHV